MKISPARTAAFDILLRIETERAYSSVLLPLFEADLQTSDRSLCHNLTLGVLRRQLSLDKTIDYFSGGKKLDVEVRIALRLALYQLSYLDKVPVYSAINESVNLVQRAKKTSAKGLANAILRRAVRERPVLNFQNEIERVSIESSHPSWLVGKWIDQFGILEAAKIAAANNEPAATAFRPIGAIDENARNLIEASRVSTHVRGCYIADKTVPDLFELAAKGEIYIQDEASQLAAQAVEIPPGGRFLDVCAAPGGKTGLIALRYSSSTIVAGDLRWPRIEFLRENCRRQGAESVNIVQYDAQTPLPFEEAAFDSVLVDAPCSGTGTIRRNPEIRYFLKPADFAQLQDKQLSILINASKLVATGGLLVYSTCSFEREENEEVCSRFLSHNADFEIVKPNVPDVFYTDEGFARTWPHRDGMDGFFIAAFRRA